MSTTIGEFVLDLFVDAGKGELTINNLVASMGQLEVASVGEIAILGELAVKLSSIVDHNIKLALGIEHVTSTTGMSSKVLQEWGNMAEYVGISGEKVKDVLGEVSHNLAMGKYMGDYGGLKNLGELLKHARINLADFKAEHPEELVKKIRDSKWFQDQTASVQFTLLSGSGLQGILEMMQKKRISDAEWKQYVSEGPVLSESELKHYDYIHRRMVEIRQLSTSIGEAIIAWTSTAFLGWFDKVGSAMKEIDDWLGKKTADGKKQTWGEKFQELAPEIKSGSGSVLANLATGGMLSNLTDALNALIPQKAYPEPYDNSKVGHTFNMVNNLKIEGNPKISHAETFDAIKFAFEGVFNPVAAQSNLGPL